MVKNCFSSPSLSQQTESEIESRKKFRSNANNGTKTKRNETKRNETKRNKTETKTNQKKKKSFGFDSGLKLRSESNRLFWKKRFIMMKKMQKNLRRSDLVLNDRSLFWVSYRYCWVLKSRRRPLWNANLAPLMSLMWGVLGVSTKVASGLYGRGVGLVVGRVRSWSRVPGFNPCFLLLRTFSREPAIPKIPKIVRCQCSQKKNWRK